MNKMSRSRDNGYDLDTDTNTDTDNSLFWQFQSFKEC